MAAMRRESQLLPLKFDPRFYEQGSHPGQNGPLGATKFAKMNEPTDQIVQDLIEMVSEEGHLGDRELEKIFKMAAK